MQVSYSGQSLSTRYSCTRGRGMYGTASCQTVGGRRIERAAVARDDHRDHPHRERPQQRAVVQIVWEGGAVTDHEVTLPNAGSHAATDEDTLELVRRLAKDYPDHQIASILARQGRLAGAGKPFTAHRVRSLRHHYKIPASEPGTRPPGTDAVTVAQAAGELGVSTATVHRWVREGSSPASS